MTFSPDQRQLDAMDDVMRWFSDPNSPQVYRLFGYAGTGKTTLARHIADQLGGGWTLYAAYSGKAASVLRNKGCHGASTIHSLIYLPKEKSREELRALELEYEYDPSDALKLKVDAARAELLRPEFRLNEDSALRQASLLILDEVSMVNAEMARDLQSFGTRILCLGDPAQLPPVEGGGYYTDATPNTLLTSIHRSAADSPVTRLATIARQSDDAQHGVSEMDGDSGRWTGGKLSLSSFDQVLVGKNKTRWTIISRMRNSAGNAGKPPQPGERILTLANNPDQDVFNGEQFTIQEARADRLDSYRLTVRTDEGWVRELVVRRDGFHGLEGEAESRRHGRRGPAAATYAHAITTHKAQGSQWGRVLVLDESSVFSWMHAKSLRESGMGRAEAQAEGAKQGRRWFYTALTRAVDQVVVRDWQSR